MRLISYRNTFLKEEILIFILFLNAKSVEQTYLATQY